MDRVKRLIGLILAVCCCVTVAFAAQTDGVQADDAEKDGYLSSYVEPITREEFCYLIISLMAEMQETTVDELYNKLTDKQKTESFVDVEAENRYIALAKKYELVEGKDGYVFSPDDPIKRQEVASIVLNLVQKTAPEYFDEDFDYGTDIDIEDHVEIAEWAETAADFMLYTELMELDQNDNFDPTAPMTVEEAVILISGLRVYLTTPLPAEEPVEEEGIPAYVWIIAAAALAVLLLVVLIIVLVRRSKQKKQSKQQRESMLEEELNRRLSVTENSVAPAAPQKTYRRPAEPQRNSQTAPVTGTIEPRPPRSAAAAVPPPPAFSRPAQTDEGETVFMGAVQSPRIRITGVQGVEVERTFALDVPLTIGRAEDNLLQLSHGTISRSHCRIRRDGARVLIESTGARNPIRILRGTAEQPVPSDAPAELRSGDVLLLGGLRLKVDL